MRNENRETKLANFVVNFEKARSHWDNRSVREREGIKKAAETLALNITSKASARVVSGLTDATSRYIMSLTRILAIVIETIVDSASSFAPIQMNTPIMINQKLYRMPKKS